MDSRPLKASGSLAASFIFMVLVLFILGQGSAWVWFLFTQKDHNQRMVRDKVEAVAGFFSEVMGPVIDKKDYGALQAHAEKVLRDEDIVSVRVKDAQGRLILSLASEEADSREIKSVNPLYVPRSSTYSHPVVSGEKRIGTVEVQYSGKRVNKVMLGLMTFPPVVEALVLLAVMFAIYVYFQRRIGTPIGLIQQRIEQVTEGDLSVRMPDVGRNEIGVIAAGLDFLVERLSSTVQGLNAASDSLASAVGSLHGTFEKISDRMSQQSSSTEKIADSMRRTNASMKGIIQSTDALSRSSAENASSLLEIKATGDEMVNSMQSLFLASDSSFATGVEVSDVSASMAEIVRNVLESVESTTASVDEIVSSVREVERSAKDSSRLAENVKEEAAQRGVESVAEAVKGMELITEKVRYSSELVSRLDSRSKDVQKVLAVIREVTEQTNLLSLNAAILAEQAGEFGKGFSVVADEMRALSNRTASYTKEIADIVNTIQAEIKEIVLAIEMGMKIVKEGSETVYRVGETMSSVLESAYESAMMTRGIEKATEEQANSLRYIQESVVSINNMANRMDRAMGEQLKRVGSIGERVGELRELAGAAKRSTEEQAAGTAVISRNLEQSSGSVEEINQAVTQQQKVNDGIIMALEGIRKEGEQNVADMAGATASILKVQKDIENLRKKTEKFKLR